MKRYFRLLRYRWNHRHDKRTLLTVAEIPNGSLRYLED